MNDYQIQQATTRRDQQEAALLRPDGTKIYGEQEDKERRHAIRREFEATMGRVEADISERVAAAQEEILIHENADPASSLSTEELQRAAAMNAFVAGEVESLSVADLVRRCRTAAGSGDRAAMYALAHHAGRRADEEETAFELAEAVADLRRKLAPEREAKMAKAREDLAAAEDLRFDAQLARQGGAFYAPSYSYRAASS